jgi:lipoate-protein ligase B
MTMFLQIHDLKRIAFPQALTFQIELRNQIKLGQTTPFHLVFCEHDPVITKGRNFEATSLPHPEEYYRKKNIAIENVDRGGDVTFHGPGQITAYFLFDLNQSKKDIHHFIHQLEEIVILCLKDFNLNATRNVANSGVWVGEEKMCAIGVGFKHWISYHGIGFNINTDMNYFNDFIPCGLKTKGVTSLKKALQSTNDIDLDIIKEKLVHYTCQVFHLHFERQLEQLNGKF